MYTTFIPPVSHVKAKLEFYQEQTQELFKTCSELSLAYELVKDYCWQDAEYYADMNNWLHERYGYVLGNALTFIPGTI